MAKTTATARNRKVTTAQGWIKEFVGTECLVGDGEVAVGDLLQAYSRFCFKENVSPLSQSRFRVHIRDRVPGLAVVRRGSVTVLQGICLRAQRAGEAMPRRMVIQGLQADVQKWMDKCQGYETDLKSIAEKRAALADKVCETEAIALNAGSVVSRVKFHLHRLREQESCDGRAAQAFMLGELLGMLCEGERFVSPIVRARSSQGGQAGTNSDLAFEVG